MIQGYGHQIDQNDLDYALTHFPKGLSWNHKIFYAKGSFHPNVTDFVDKDGVHHAIFHIKPIYYESVDGFVRPLSEITASHGNRHIALKDNWEQFVSFRYFTWLMRRQAQIGSLSIQGYTLQPRHYVFATTTDYYPDASPESATVDGHFESDGTARSWASTIALTTGTASDTSTQLFNAGWRVNVAGTTFSFLERSIFLFDTSAIGSGSTISSASMNLYGVSKGLATGDAIDVNIYSSAPATDTAVVSGDFDSLGSTAYCDTAINYSGWSTSGYNTFTLNATGIGAISKTGITKFGGRDASHDVAASAPPATSAGDSYLRSASADDVSGTKDPKLTVTYSAGGGTPVVRNSNLLLMGVG